MESNQGGRMRISWVLANNVNINPAIDLEKLKAIGPFWGGWRTWRSYQTDNVICHEESEARDLLGKNFHSRCNMYLPEKVYQSIDRPSGIKLYQGTFHELVDNPDEIVSMHLASTVSDVILLAGFDVSPKSNLDKLATHKWHNYVQYFYHILLQNPELQWVLLDHLGNIESVLKKVPNLQFDTLENVLAQFR